MSKFNLGKIQPTPRGEYQTDKAYAYLDIVTSDGSSYICKNRSGAPAGYSVENPSYWQIIACRGKDGEGLAYRVTGTHVQVKLESEEEWTDVVAIANLKGDKGDKGDTGPAGKDGKDGKNGMDGEVTLATMNAGLALKADTATVNAALAKKADTTTVNTKLKDKVSQWQLEVLQENTTSALDDIYDTIKNMGGDKSIGTRVNPYELETKGYFRNMGSYYYKNSDGLVVVIIEGYALVTITDLDIATMPAGFKPEFSCTQALLGITASTGDCYACECILKSDGQIYIRGPIPTKDDILGVLVYYAA